LRDFHLHARFTRAGARREDVENQLSAIHHPGADDHLDVLSLRWREFVIEDDERCLQRVDERLELLDLAAAEVRRRVRPIELLRQCADDDRTGRIGQTRELFEMLVGVMACRAALGGRTDQDGALDRRREGDGLATDVTIPDDEWSE
jgi:hypothetical protein